MNWTKRVEASIFIPLIIKLFLYIVIIILALDCY